ncbi:MAG: alpha/beta hydrolase [Bacteroidales bacterium]|nr:alpha/beta hydrolase [Bacteroidales bacterium]
MKSNFLLLSVAVLLLTSCGNTNTAKETEKSNSIPSDSIIVEQGGTGDFKAVMFEDTTLKAHTIFCPKDLSKFSKENPLPILVWGNGACTNSPWEHYKFLNEIASHGFVVVATGFMPRNEEPYHGDMSTTEQQIESIDWAIAQNSNQNSYLFNKLDVNNIAAAGMSCGGLQTLFNCADPRLKTIMICNSGLFIDAKTAIPNMPMPEKSKLDEIHTPIIYILGGESDIAYTNGMDDFHRIKHVPAFAANYPVGHGGTYSQPHGGEFSIVATAWLQWQLKGDTEAAKMFKGENCGVAQREKWTAEKNELIDK